MIVINIGNNKKINKSVVLFVGGILDILSLLHSLQTPRTHTNTHLSNGTANNSSSAPQPPLSSSRGFQKLIKKKDSDKFNLLEPICK